VEGEQTENNIGLKPDINDFLVIGIGASAGGVEALQAFFRQVPADSNMVYVVILHLSPDYDSQLTEILQRETSLPVTQVTEKVSIEPDHIYVVPPNQHLLMMEDAIAVSPNLLTEDRRAPVDIFFRSLAETYQSRAVGIILSGTGANGSMGIKRIKERGGAAFVQNPRETQFNEMPRNAIATDLIDSILPVTEIPTKLISYRNNLTKVHIAVENNNRPEDQQHALREIFTQLRMRTKHDFSNYKRPTLLRRIERRINVHNLNSITAYSEYIQQHAEEAHALLKDLLISVTNFFRDKKAFEAIERDILPRLFHDKTANSTLRIWTIGCATGEEAYSLAILCAERANNRTDVPKVQIFATDIDNDAISVARNGVYTLNDVADVSPERLRRYFTKEGDAYRIRREIREMILFADHNVLKDPPFSHIDMITCRNLMIYLNSTAQERVLETMHFALEPGSYLFLGSAESVDGAGDLFLPINREQHIYQSRAVSTRFFPVPESVPDINHTKIPEQKISQEAENRALGRISYADLHQQLLEQYAPPSIVVNQDFDIVHLSEKAGSYLHVAGGELSKNLLKLIRPELRLELRTAFYQAVERRANVEARGLKIKSADDIETINIHVRPVLRDGDTAQGFMLVLFEPSTSEPENENVVYTTDEPMARHLEEELIRMKTQLRTNIEQQELQAEELKASNEELQAINEELRSAVEELETSKEELQSINEELTTVNQELKVKVEETTLSNNNFQNLINSTEIATIFLDRSFRINMFTPAAKEIFNMIPADFGRPLTDITNKLDYPGLQDDAEVVLEKLKTVEREISASNGNIYLMRALPYRTEEDRINGVIITFINITERKRWEEALRQSEERMRLLIESAKDYAIFTLNTERKIVSWSTGAEAMFGYSEREITGQPSDLVFTLEDREAGVPEKETDIAAKESRAENERWHQRKNGSRFWGSGITSPLHNEKGELIGFVKIMRDLTESRQAEEQLRASEERFRTLTNAVPQVIWTNEPDGRANYFNQRWYEYSGLSYEESAGPGWMAIIHPDDEFASVERWQKALAAGEIFDTEYRLRRADGVYRWHLGRNVPLRNDTGEVISWFGSATDIEDLNIAQASLIESEERYRAIVSQSSVGIVRADINGTLIFMNEKGRSMLGFNGNNGTERTLWELTASEDVDELKRLYKRLTEEALPFQFEGKLKRLNGSLFWASVSMAPIKDVKGKTGSGVAVIVDITGRKQAEEALRETMERFQYAVQATKDVIWEIDFQRDHVWWSSMMHTLFGYSQREIQHSLAWYQSLIHPDDQDRVSKSFVAAVEGKETLWTDEFRYRKAKGEYLYVVCRSFIIRDGEGKALQMIGAMQDITERRLAEDAVRKSEERLRVTVQSATDYVIITMDVNGNIESWNSGAERIFGYKAEELIGKYTGVIYTPGDRAANAAEKEMETAKKDGRATDERWHLRKNGSRIFLSGVLAPIRNNGTLTGFVKVARDMTAQKEAEDALQTVQNSLNTALEAAQMGVWDINFATGEVIRSPRHDQLLGYPTLQEQWSTEKAKQYLVPEDKDKFDSAYQNMLSIGIFNLEARVNHNNESVYWIHYYGRVFRNEKGEPTHAAGVIFDITDRKMVEQKKDEFIGIASHELKTPVTSIKAYTEILHEQFEEAGDVQSALYLSKLNQQIDRLAGLIRDLLDATRIAEGRLSIKETKFDLNQMLHDIADELQRTTSKHTIELNLQELGSFKGDKEKLQQVFVNLLSNAIKYSPEESKLVVKSYRDDNNINIEVQDFGIGMSPETQNRLFERFFRSADPHISTFPGLGLGLYISMQIVKQHKGTIRVQSEKGKGSVFTVVLPI
jgi:two-component system CheB/CheR fusion protein